MNRFEVKQGDCLIADPFLTDESFTRSVVLICEVNTSGALGFIINKSLPQKLDSLVKEIGNCPFPVHYGGPVKLDTLHFLHSRPDLFPDSFKIGHGIYWGGNFDVAMDLIKRNEIDGHEIKIFLGQSGWADEQLSREIDGNTWLKTESSQKLLFQENPKLIWKESIKTLGKKYEEIINYPLDPTLN